MSNTAQPDPANLIPDTRHAKRRYQARLDYHDWIDRHVGNVTVQGVVLDISRPRPPRYLKCLCDCGATTYIRPNRLKAGKQTSCGCQEIRKPAKPPHRPATHRERRKPGPDLSILKRRFGHLTVTQPAEPELYYERPGRHTFFYCLCDCGRETVVRTDALKSGNTTSCGCAKTALRGRPLREIRNKRLRQGW